jgi:hypothetical protein
LVVDHLDPVGDYCRFLAFLAMTPGLLVAWRLADWGNERRIIVKDFGHGYTKPRGQFHR